MKYDAKPSWIEVVGPEDLDQPARQRDGEGGRTGRLIDADRQGDRVGVLAAGEASGH